MKDSYDLYEDAKHLIEDSDVNNKELFLEWLRQLYISINNKDYDLNTKAFLFFKKRDGIIDGLFNKINRLTGEIYAK